MLVDEIMAKDVVTIESNESVLDACKRYNRYRIGSLIVMDNNKMVGIITERDIISRVIIKLKNPETTMISEIMSKDIKTIRPTADVREAAEIMGHYKIKKLPVISDMGNLVGVVTITDIANILPNFLRTLAEGGGGESFRYVAQRFQQ